LAAQPDSPAASALKSSRCSISSPLAPGFVNMKRWQPATPRSPARPTLLFVCVHNAGRSQLAAGLAALRGRDQVNVLSAGLDPDDKVSDVALASLAEVGIDRSDQTPTKLTDDLVAQADVVVGLKPGLDLPHHDGVRYETWPLPDPADWDIDGIRPLRDYIDVKVQKLIKDLHAAN
jgi:protein-tyrosine-phosphatase